jgi:hypothetical protein
MMTSPAKPPLASNTSRRIAELTLENSVVSIDSSPTPLARCTRPRGP